MQLNGLNFRLLIGLLSTRPCAPIFVERFFNRHTNNKYR